MALAGVLSTFAAVLWLMHAARLKRDGQPEACRVFLGGLACVLLALHSLMPGARPGSWLPRSFLGDAAIGLMVVWAVGELRQWYRERNAAARSFAPSAARPSAEERGLRPEAGQVQEPGAREEQRDETVRLGG